MDREQDCNQEKYCGKCRRLIRLDNFILHDLRCKGPSSVSQSEISQPSINNSIPRERSNVRPPPPNRPSSIQGEEEKIPCHFCGYLQTLNELDTHPNTCEHRDQPCPDCNGMFPLSLMDQHKIACPARRQHRHHHHHRHRHVYPSQQQQQEGFIPPFGSPFMFNPMRMHAMNNQMGGPRFMISLNGGQPMMYEGRGGGGLAPFFELISLMASRGNQQQHPSLSKEQIKNLESVKYQPKSSERDICTICYCQFEDKEEINKLNCNHLYHKQCIGKWLQKNAQCPVCKKSQLPNRRDHRARSQQDQNELFD